MEKVLAFKCDYCYFTHMSYPAMVMHIKKCRENKGIAKKELVTYTLPKMDETPNLDGYLTK